MISQRQNHEKKPCFLAGDFNMSLLQLENNPEIESYFDMMTNQSFTPLITYPTRITNKSKTLIDNILSNEFSSNIVSGNLTVGISDHMPQFTLIPTNISKIKSSTQEHIYIRKCKNIDTHAFNQDLDKIDWDPNGFEVHQYGQNFLNVFNQVLDVHAPLTKIKIPKNDAKRNALDHY